MGTPNIDCNDTGHRAPSNTGIMLVDDTGRPIYYNCEAMAILFYPKRGEHLDTLSDPLPGEIRSLLRVSIGAPSTMTEFTSGRRTYECRVFALNGNSRTRSRGVTGVFMERGASKTMKLSKISKLAERFRLTQREQETIGLLAQGLTSKQIAARMNISPNTVKTFFRLVMTKMGVSTRSGIVGKIVYISE